MDLLVGMVQEMGNVMQAAGILEATGRARKAHRPVLAFRAEGLGAGSWGLGTGEDKDWGLGTED